MKHILLVIAAVGVCTILFCSDNGNPATSSLQQGDSDSTRLGGFKKLSQDSWWCSVDEDTTISTFDSANVTIITKDTVIHHSRSIVTAIDTSGDTLYYTISQIDTVVDSNGTGPKPPTSSTVNLVHTFGGIDILVDIYSNKIPVRAIALPLMVGNSWVAFDTSIDSSARYQGLKIAAHFGTVTNGLVTGTSSYLYGNAARQCYDISEPSNDTLRVVADTTIFLFGNIPLVSTGDIVTQRISHSDKKYYVEQDLALILRTTENSTGIDSVHIPSQEPTKTTTVTKSSSRIVASFNAATQETLYLAP